MANRRISLKTSIPYYYPERKLPCFTVEEVEDAVGRCTEALLNGDAAKGSMIKQKIVESLLRLAFSVATLWAAKYVQKKDDITGVALLALVKAVDRFFVIPNHDKSIQPYVVAKIGWALKDYLAEDHLIRIPACSVFKHIEAGTIEAINNNTKITTLDIIQEIIGRLSPRKVSSLAVEGGSNYDVRDIMDVVLQNDEDKRFMTLKVVGCSEKEIAADIGKSVSYVYQHKNQLIHKIKLRLTAAVG